MNQKSVCLRAVTVALAIALLGGCTKKKDEQAQAGGGEVAPGAPGAAAKGPGGKAVNWEKIERVPFARLQALLPETVLGLKRSDLRGSTTPDGERTYSEGAADYTGADDVHLTLTIQDHPVQALENIGSKTTSFKGYPVTRERESSEDAHFDIVVGDRFTVQAHGQKLKAAQLRTAFEKIDLAKLATWKLEGVK